MVTFLLQTTLYLSPLTCLPIVMFPVLTLNSIYALSVTTVVKGDDLLPFL